MYLIPMSCCYIFYPIASGRTSAMKSEYNDRLQMVAENVTELVKRMVIQSCAGIECKYHMKFKAPSKYFGIKRKEGVREKLY